MRKEALGLLEQQAELGHIDLYYGDETCVSEMGYVPYGWQFKGEQVVVPSARGKSMNYLGLLSRDNHLIYTATPKSVTSSYVVGFLDEFSMNLRQPTVVVLDNASAHTAKKFKRCLEAWQQRGLYIFYLPPYSPQLNIIERFWKELKEGWLKPEDYQSADSLFYAVNRIFSRVGQELSLNFSAFKQPEILNLC